MDGEVSESRVHKGAVVFEELSVGDTLVGVSERGWKLLRRYSIGEAHHIVKQMAENALLDAGKENPVKAADLPPEAMREIEAFDRHWQNGRAVVVDLHPLLGTVTVVTRGGGEFQLRSFWLPAR